MNAPAFVLASAPLRAVLTSRPWLCGTRIATAPRLPTRSRLPSRIFACTPPPTDEPAAVEEDVPQAAPAPDAADDAAPEDVAESPVAEEAAGEAADEGSEGAAAGADDQKRKKRRRARKREVTLPLEDIVVGQELEGVVRSVTDYGAFIGDMGTPTDGLLHVSQLAAGFVENVTDVVNVGDKVTVRVLGVDTAKGNFSLTMKTATELEERRGGGDGKKNRRDDKKEKWNNFKYDPKEFVDARVTSITDFGAFCQFLNESGEVLESAPTEGLIHISEISENRVNNVSDVLSVGQGVKVRVLATDRKRNRISMSLKEFSEDNIETSKSDIAADMEKAASNQPTFKTSFELAFERAKASSSQ